MCILRAICIVLDMIYENNPITNAFISVPSDMGQLNCAAFIAGIIAGILDSSKLVRTLIFTYKYTYTQ